MTAVAITGGIGSGKSTAARILADGGFSLVDTDSIAREVVRPGTEGLRKVVDAFGDRMLCPDGTLDRNALATRVFSAPEERRRLEEILHPLIRVRWMECLDGWRSAGAQVGFVVIPLLFEKGYQQHFDRTVSLHCTAATQWRRLEGRGWTPEEIRGRLAAQWSSGAKADQADHVVWTEGSLGVHEAQWRRLTARAGWVSGSPA